MKIVFFGTPDFATASLKALVDAKHEISLVVTQPDRRAGRGQKMSQSSVKRFALAQGLPLEQPMKMRDEAFHEKLRSIGAQVFVVAAYGRLLPTAILSISETILNVHASLLPRWRGAAPIARSILTGDSTTGISIMRIVEELDAGDVLLREEIPIGENETAGGLTDRLATLGGEALLGSLKKVEEGSAKFTPQDSSKVTFAPQVKSEEGKIDWSRSAQEIHNQVRAFNPWPGTVTSDGKQHLKIFQTRVTKESSSETPVGTLRGEKGRLWVSTNDCWIEVIEVQREGKKRQETKHFLPGYAVSTVRQWRSG